jgi:UDP-N-acetylmuramoyl-L-alanyl-D-glutamate--2,6-diaminopimelate ligase
MKLTALLKPLRDAVVVNSADRSIRGLTLDSRRVRPGDLFAVVPGPHCDGMAYVRDAIARGAVAILASTKAQVPPDVTLVLVPEVRLALADLACRFYGSPADLVRIVGVTGTNGKTTTATLVRWLLAHAGKQAALLSTVVHQIGTRRIPASNTTPESPELQSYLAEMVERHIGYAVMEVSSHSLDQERVRGIRFTVAALTNVTPHEHLDYHRSFDAYKAAKAKLFESLAPEATAVLNADDAHFAYYAERRGPGKRMSYGIASIADCRLPIADCPFEEAIGNRKSEIGNRKCDVTGVIEAADLLGMTLRISTPVGHERVRSPLIGAYNAQNLLAGVCCALALGLDLPAIAAGIERFTGAPGRLERVDEGQPFTVLIDYAHNNDGLRSVLSTLRPLVTGRLIVVFGAGGDRDPSKRPLMGGTAARYADLTVLTADNSRSEKTEDIVAAIRAGMPSDAPCLIEPGRREAIRRAIAAAEPGDLVLLAGKGHETYQEIGGVRYPFDDREEAEQALRSLSLRRAKVAGRAALGIGVSP